MKRKVIQIAESTVLVSIPNKWAKKYGFKKGDSVDVEEENNKITITAEKVKEVKKIEFNIDKFKESSFRYVMSAVHKAGYDEITIHYDKPDFEFNNVVQDLLNGILLGFIVVDQTSKKLVMRSVAQEIELEFDSALRRTFLIINSFAASTYEMINSKQFEKLISLLNLENSINQLTSFCLRLMNKAGYKDKQIFLATVIWNIEKIADEYKLICIELSKNNKKINNEIIIFHKETNNLLNYYTELFYNFSVEKLNSINEKKGELLKNRIKIRANSQYEEKLLIKLSTIISKISDMLSSTSALNCDKLK